MDIGRHMEEIRLSMRMENDRGWKQKIIGYKNKDSRAYRFVTMVIKADGKIEKSLFGEFAHRSGIDYLPMYVSVLLGYMILVGLERIPIEEKMMQY